MPDSLPPLLETALYPAVKRFLEERGFAVKGEVRGCDVVATRAGEPPLLVITELKLSFTLELVLQAVDRLRLADEVWLAVVSSRRGRDRDGRVLKLCRLLGLGLLAVEPRHQRVEVLAEPMAYKPRPNLPERRRIVKEFGNRRGDPVAGGSTRQPIMTAYRQRALDLAVAMLDAPQRPRDLKPLAEDAGTMLLRNVHGWFERVQPGLYSLTEPGRQAALAWREAPITG